MKFIYFTVISFGIEKKSKYETVLYRNHFLYVNTTTTKKCNCNHRTVPKSTVRSFQHFFYGLKANSCTIVEHFTDGT